MCEVTDLFECANMNFVCSETEEDWNVFVYMYMFNFSKPCSLYRFYFPTPWRLYRFYFPKT